MITLHRSHPGDEIVSSPLQVYSGVLPSVSWPVSYNWPYPSGGETYHYTHGQLSAESATSFSHLDKKMWKYMYTMFVVFSSLENLHPLQSPTCFIILGRISDIASPLQCVRLNLPEGFVKIVLHGLGRFLNHQRICNPLQFFAILRGTRIEILQETLGIPNPLEGGQLNPPEDSVKYVCCRESTLAPNRGFYTMRSINKMRFEGPSRSISKSP